MSAYERKIIHSALQDSEFVNTYSIGEEPRRKVVIEKQIINRKITKSKFGILLLIKILALTFYNKIKINN